MSTMKSGTRASLEPGLLHIFQLFVGARLVLHLLALFPPLFAREQRLPRYPLLAILESAFLLGYLLWPWLRQRLGPAYLPIALGIATVGPLVEHALNVGLRIGQGLMGAGAATDAWQLYLLLFVPLIILSWQYPFWTVVAFSASTAILDLMLAFPLALLGGPRVVTVLALVFVRSLLFVLVGYLVVRLMGAQRQQRQALARANAQLARYASTLEQLAISRERNRLARELHDTLAHSLSSVAVQLEAVNTLWAEDPKQAKEMLRQALEATRRGLEEARRAIRALRASPLDDLGLVLGIRSLAESLAERAGLRLDLQLPERLDGLHPEVEQCVYRVTQEALSNVARHAEARHLSVRLEQDASRLTLTVSDDGRGFDLAAAVSSDAHYGLRGMRERAALIGAGLDIKSWPGHGTTVQLTVEEAFGSSGDL